MSFCRLTKWLTPKIRVLCGVIIKQRFLLTFRVLRLINLINLLTFRVLNVVGRETCDWLVTGCNT